MHLRLALAVSALALVACGNADHGTSSGEPSTPAATSARGATQSTTARFASWTTYHGDRLRTGYAATMPAASGVPRVLHRYSLDGQVYASPLVIRGRAVVATENNTVYKIRHGHVVWRRHLGTPAAQSQLPCGNIFPLGITGTPVHRKGLVYVAAELGGATPHHRLFALRLSTGAVVWRRSLDLPGVETRAMQQRGALVVAGGRVWVPFGGLAGDCGGYKGRVVGLRIGGHHGAIAYTVPTRREAGIWTPPGPSFDGTYLYVAVGNGAATGSPYDKSDSVLSISTTARLHQYFAPSSWASENASDADLGSQGPAIVGRWIFAAGKSGRAYVLDRSHLGGIGGQVSSRDLCRSFGGPAVVGSRVYVPCTDGVRAVRIDSTGHLHVLWHAASSVTGSPVVGGGRVWSLDPAGGRLYALDPADGHRVNSVAVGETSRFATPAIYGRKLFVPTLGGLTVVGTS